jgi:hypothetical protein
MAPIKYKSLEMSCFEKDAASMPRVKQRRSPRRVYMGIFLAGLLFFVWGWNDADKRYKKLKEHGGPHKSASPYKAPKKNIWSDLDEDEFKDILAYLYTVPNDLNLTRTGKTGP